MIALEGLAALVTIIGGIVAAFFWMYGRIANLRRENDGLRGQIQSMRAAPQQPLNADYLVDDDQNRLCIRCYNTSQSRWKLLKESDCWKCPVCGAESRHEARDAVSNTSA
jgi:hypothetical protein